MKKQIYFLVLLFSFTLSAEAQKFTHEIGMSYNAYSGYRNYFDDASIVYIPGIRYTSGKSYLSALLPLNFTRVVSTSRSAHFNTIEIPLVLEWGFSPGNAGNRNKVQSLFIGTGFTAYNSKPTENNRGNIVSNHYALAYAGTRIRLGGAFFGLRLSYGRTLDFKITRNQRIGLALTYIIK